MAWFESSCELAPPRTVAQTPLPVGAGLEHSGLPEQQVLVSEVHSPLRPVQVVSTLHSCRKEAAGIRVAMHGGKLIKRKLRAQLARRAAT